MSSKNPRFICPFHGVVEGKPASVKRKVLNPKSDKEVEKTFEGYQCPIESCSVQRLTNECEYA